MKKRIPYWLYKTGFTEFKAKEYDAKTKTIEVDLPEYKKPKFPADWIKEGNTYYTQNGCRVTFWGSGLAENFEVEHFVSVYNCQRKSIGPCIDAREKVMNFVSSFDK